MSSDIIANRLSEALANVALLDPIPGKQKQLSRPIDIPSATEQWIQSGGPRSVDSEGWHSLWSDGTNHHPWAGREQGRRHAASTGSVIPIKMAAHGGAHASAAALGALASSSTATAPRDASSSSVRAPFARHSSWSDPSRKERGFGEHEYPDVFDAVHTTSTRMTDFLLDDPHAHNRALWAQQQHQQGQSQSAAARVPSSHHIHHEEGSLGSVSSYGSLAQAQTRQQLQQVGHQQQQRRNVALMQASHHHHHHQHQQNTQQHLAQRVQREAVSAQAALSASTTAARVMSLASASGPLPSSAAGAHHHHAHHGGGGGHSHSHSHGHGAGGRVRHFSLSSYESMDSFFDHPEPKQSTSPVLPRVRLQRLNTYSGHTPTSLQQAEQRHHSHHGGYAGSNGGGGSVSVHAPQYHHSHSHSHSHAQSSATAAAAFHSEYDFHHHHGHGHGHHHAGSLPNSLSAGPRVPSFSSQSSGGSVGGGQPRMQRQSSNLTAPPGTIYVNSAKKRQSSQAANAESYDIEQGLNLQRVAQIPFVGGRKIVAYHSKRTNRRTVVSVIDPKYLLGPNHQDHCDGESGFLTFHDCVELRTLKTGETLTRNQRNNLRKRLATTARTIVQVDVPRLLQDFSDPDCCPRTTYHHSKLNAYLVTAAVGQVLLCTRDNDNGTEPYKGQSLQSQTLFDLCKSENAAAALAEFIKANQSLDLNTRDFKGMCPIHYSAKVGLKDTIEVLIKFGADVNVTDKSDQSPLHYAIYNGHKAVQFQLLQAGARVDTRNVSGNTLLHVAAYHDQREVAAAILAQNPELVHVRNHKFDSTPLECAMHKGLTEMVRLLSMQAPPLPASIAASHHPADHVRPLSAMLPSDMLDGDDLAEDM